MATKAQIYALGNHANRLTSPACQPRTTNYELRTNTNKANLLNAQMNVNKVLTKDYENVHLHRRGKNKANTNPNKANLLNAQMNVSYIITKGYENKPRFRAKAKQTQYKANTNPIKPNFKGKNIWFLWLLFADSNIELAA